MTLRANIEQTLREAQKRKDEIVVSTLRLVLASMKNRVIELHGQELSDDEVVSLLKREAKRRQESIEAFAKGGREDLRAKEAQELEILQRFLPPELAEAEIQKIIDQVLIEIPGSDMTKFGQVMGSVMKRLGNRANGQTVQTLVKKALSKHTA